jgi:sulfate adenylyltransferase subunit 1
VLRFLTCGSVDDGKSTLIGRLLYDTKALLSDTLATLEKHAERRGLSAPDLSLLTDGLVAEREQGITIDVAYRYFATARRKFIIADSPGHVQYTRNMVTAASTADAAVLLVDARKGIADQTRRHATIAGLLGVRHLIVAVNKMDLVDYSSRVFESIAADFRGWLEQQPSLHVRTDTIPISALEGANVVERDERLAWHAGPTLIELLEQAPAHEADAQAPLRLPVQWVCRPPQSEFRGYAGRIESGSLAVGDPVVVLPSGQASRVAAIRIGERALEWAVAGESVLVQLTDELDISRGDLIALRGDRVLAGTARAGASPRVPDAPRHARNPRAHPQRRCTPGHRNARLARRTRSGRAQRDRAPGDFHPAPDRRRCLRIAAGHRQLHPDRSDQLRHGRRRPDRVGRPR